jgi:hypothetical protein
VSFEDFIQKSMKGLLGLGFKDFWAYYPTTLMQLKEQVDTCPIGSIPSDRPYRQDFTGP